MSGARPAHPVRPETVEAQGQGQAGNVKVTREEWLGAAMDVLISDGVERVKILGLAERLGVSRSSFYWYFRSREDLLDQLLAHWKATNTAALVRFAGEPAPTVGAAVCNIWRAMIDPEHFNNPLDFAVRDWARRSARVKAVLDASDRARIDAISAMFARYGYGATEALVRARTLYYMQIGYNDADLHEPMAERMGLTPHYVLVFTGRPAAPGDAEALEATARRLEAREPKAGARG